MEFKTFWDIVHVLEGKTIQMVNPYDVDGTDGIVLTCTDGTKLVVAADLEDNDGLSAWPFGTYEKDTEDTTTH